MIITLDGTSGSGKSTIADRIAKKLGFIHFNSGNLYRALTCFFVFNDYDMTNFEKQTFNFPIVLKVKYFKGVQHVYVNDVDYTAHLHENLISINAPKISPNPFLRSLIDTCQRDFAKNNDIVVDGRDLGSFVFPNADIKFYIDCDVKERARRRCKDLKNTVEFEEIVKQLQERDRQDKTRKIAPLVVPDGAIVIDSTKQTLEETVAEVFGYIKKRFKKFKNLT